MSNITAREALENLRQWTEIHIRDSVLRGLTIEQKAGELERVVDQIGDALLLRARRRRKGAK